MLQLRSRRFWGASEMEVVHVPTRVFRAVLFLFLLMGIGVAAASEPMEAAKRVDATFTRGLDKTAPLPALADDATFLRRVSLDLAGVLPSPEEVRSFTGDAD